MLRHGLIVIAVVVGLLAPVAQAHLETGDPIDIVGGTVLGQWGTGILGGPPLGFNDPFGDIYQDEFWGTSVNVSASGFLDKMFYGAIQITYEPAYLQIGGFIEHIDIGPIKEAGDNLIISVNTNIQGATITTDGFSISFDALLSDIDAAQFDTVVIGWTQIPTPGSLALLGVAGLMGGCRRRR